MNSRMAQIRFGRRYGYLKKTLESGKRSGQVVCGSANVPPIQGPIIVPMLQTNGMIEYARAVESQYSVALTTTKCIILYHSRS